MKLEVCIQLEMPLCFSVENAGTLVLGHLNVDTIRNIRSRIDLTTHFLLEEVRLAVNGYVLHEIERILRLVDLK